MKKSIVFYLITIVVAGLMLSACGGVTVEDAPPPEEVTITIWHGWQGEYYNNIATVFARYEEANPEITIELVEVPDLSDKVVTAVPAGEGPDIVAFANDWIGRLSEADIIIALDDYLDKAEYEATYTPLAVQSQTYKGSIWGFPEAMEAITLIYNKALISEDQLPQTTDELLVNAAQWQTDHEGEYYFVYNAKNDAYFSAPWFYGSGAYFVHEDGSVGLDTEGGLAAGEFLAELRTVMPEEIDYGIADTLFKEGKAPITMNGPWYIADVEAAGIDYGMATIPAISATGTPGMPFVGVKTLMVTTVSEHPDIAVDVLEFFTSAESQVFLTEKNKTVPTNLAAIDDPAVLSLPTVVSFTEQAAFGTPMPSSPYMSALWDPVAKMLESIWTGGATPAEAIQTAQQAAEANIEDMK